MARASMSMTMDQNNRHLSRLRDPAVLVVKIKIPVDHKKMLKHVCLLFCCLFAVHLNALPQECSQLIVVTTTDWDALKGFLRCYEKNSAGCWNTVGDEIPVVVGKKGLAWGKGLHPLICGATNLKREGDGRSPAGIFALGTAFGKLSTEQVASLKMDYLVLTPTIEAVDDVHSIYYNCIVDREKINDPDWSSSEKMFEEPLYDLGVVVDHNFPTPEPGRGSAIFIHIWRGESSGTAGCTAMKKEDLERVVFWLDPKAAPCLVQLPLEAYKILQLQCNLPG